MKTKFFSANLFVIFLIISKVAAIPVFQSVTINNDTIGLYEKIEITIEMTAAFTNPFDYNQITVKANFFDKDNQHIVVDGFYYQDYTLNSQGQPVPNGSPVWKVRFSPSKTGQWMFYVQATDQQGSAYHTIHNFYCEPSQEKGFVKSQHPRYLQYDNGQSFIPVGMNMCWSVWEEYSFTVYQKWLDSLASNEGNNVKIMMVPWGMSLEWNNTPVGKYTNRLDRAFALDWTLEKARERNIYLQLCTVIHGELMNNISGTWDKNPYNVANGGPCQTAPDFFVNNTAKLYFKQKLRYINARWGYLTNIWSWEILSEADQINYYNNYSSIIRTWMIEMGNYIQSIDLHHRIVSSAFAVTSKDPAYWQSSDVDYTQLHIYDQKSDLELLLYTGIQEYLNDYSKPAFVSEYALDHEPSNIIDIDPNGISMRNCLWTTSLSGAIGSGLHWWWDNYVVPQNLFHVFKPVGKVMKSVDPIADNFISEVPECTSSANMDMEVFPGIVDAFVKAPVNQFVVKPSGIVTPSVKKMNSFEYGYLFNSYRNPPTFSVNYDKPGEFKVHTGGTVSMSHIKIWLDGSNVLSLNASANSTYTINVTVGQHTIFVENTGNGMMEIDNYEFFNYSPVLRTFMLRNNKKAVGWFQNRKYNWEYIQQHGNPPNISGGKIKLSQMNPGYYAMEWINGQTGITDSISNFLLNQQNSMINVPSVLWDGAFKLTYKYAMIPNFESNVHQGNNPLTVQFSDLTQSGVGEITSWLWSFGDGTTSTQKNPSHIYWQAGSYTVKLVVQSGSYKDSIQKNNFILVNELLEPNFIAIPTLVQNGDAINFYDLTLGNVFSWNWQFGDGSSSSLQNPSNTYNDPGIYTVTLTVQAGNLTKSFTRTNYITVVTRLLPQFFAGPIQSIINQPVQFTDQSAGNPTQWLWRFGNGNTSTAQHPQVSYSQPGFYSVKLIIKKQNFSDSLLKTGYIQVFLPLKAGYYSDRQIVMPGEPIQFTDTTSGGPQEWFWDFGDGFTSNLQNPAHNYLQPGSYNVKLKVVAGFRTDSIVNQNFITVLEPLITDFSANPTEIINGQSVSFTDNSSGNPTSWQWNFGDGDNSNLQNPVHQYQITGNYNVSLKIGILNYSDSLNKINLIQVFPYLFADFSVDKEFVQINDTLRFTDLTAGGPENWIWDFGDGSFSTLQNPLHTYSTPGVYSVKLKVTAGFRIDSLYMPDLITVKAPLSAEFTAAPTFLLTDHFVQFNDQSTGQPTFWIWDFGDQSNGIGPHPNHIYHLPGVYTVTLIVINELAVDTITKEAYITVLPPMQADFVASQTTIHKGQVISFTDLTSGSPTSWKWDFGDGQSSNQEDPTHTYNVERSFTVKLLARNSLNQSTAIKTNYITVLPPLKTQTINIPQGWSGISGFVKPDTTSIDHIFNPVINDLVILKNFSSAYWPGGNLFTLTDWDTHSGYEIKMENQASVTFRGLLEDNRQVILNQGWNLLPFISPCKLQTESFFGNVTGIAIVKEIAGNRVYWPDMGIYSLDTLLPGKSYHLLMLDTDEITYSTCPGEVLGFADNTYFEDIGNNHFNVVKNPISHIFAIPYEVIMKTWENKYLLSITSNGVVAGWCHLKKNLTDSRNKAFSITVFADDLNTDAIEGFRDGDTIQFYIADENKKILGQPEFQFDPEFPDKQIFTPYGLSKVGLLSSSFENDIVSEIKIYPNPTKGQISVFIPMDWLPVNVCMTGINNKQCLIEFPAWQQPAFQTDISGFPKGVYVMRFENASQIAFKRIVLN